jgi:hypothetical protein
MTLRKLYIVQLLVILIILLHLLLKESSYYTAIDIQPLFSSEIFSNNIDLSKNYSPEYTFSLFIKEISNKHTRGQAYKSALSEYKGRCNEGYINAPAISVYEKNDRSFPMKNEIVEIRIAGNCKDFLVYYSNFLPEYVSKNIVKNIQAQENSIVNRNYNKLLKNYNKDVYDIDSYISGRKNTLRKFINLKKGVNNEKIPMANIDSYRSLRVNVNKSKKSDKFIKISASHDAARIELDYLSSISSIDKASIGLINQLSIVNNHNVEYDFQNARLIYSSKTNSANFIVASLYLHIFLIILTLCLGYLFTYFFEKNK